MEIEFDINSTHWKTLLADSVRTPETLPLINYHETQSLKAVTEVYPMQINPYFLEVCKQKGEVIWRQVIPDTLELKDFIGWEDPLAEERDSPVPGITHRYPDRVLFLVSNLCGVYCRFCTRKRKIGRWPAILDKNIENGVAYIAENTEIKDVLLSGGDPLLLNDDRLEWILAQIRKIPHIEIIRIGSRTPGVLPQRITPALIDLLKKYQPLYLNLHFNHPDEITEPVRSVCHQLAVAGVPMGCQTVLLRGINDRAEILTALFRELLKMRIKPYYLLQADLTRGTDHFRTRIETGLNIMKQLRGHISGLAVPHYVIDLPGGGGKMPLFPECIQSMNSEYITIKNYQGNLYRYPQPGYSDGGKQKIACH